MVSPQYLDKRPELILARHATGVKGLMVLRLWNSNRIINETNATLWVGIIGVIPRSYSWLFRSSRPGEIDIDPGYLFPAKTGLGSWQWTIIHMHQPTGTKRIINQKIMLIRENNTVHKK